MTNGLSWEEQTIAKLTGVREQRDRVTQEMERAKQELDQLNALSNALETALELDRQTRGVPANSQHKVDPEKLRKLSIREVLIEFAARNNGLLVAKDAVKFLLQAGMYTNVKQARDTVYPLLHRTTKYFRKERPGVYSIVTTRPLPLTLSE